MRLTLVQSHVFATKKENIAHLEALLSEPIDTDLIVLGEMCLSPYQNDLFKENAIEQGGDIFHRLSQLAVTQDAYLVAGSVPELEGNNLYNTSFVFDPNGTLIARYRKLHLFEVMYFDGTKYTEADTITPGNDIVTFDTPFGKMGLMICFDIRFPLLAKRLQEDGVSMILVPGAFNQYTGPMHWELAFRSRAVDNQLFTVGTSPAVSSVGTYQYYGHSIVVNPFGEVLLDLGEDESIQTIEIDFGQIEQVRETIPILKNQRQLP